jgi:hypothetical protein
LEKNNKNVGKKKTMSFIKGGGGNEIDPNGMRMDDDVLSRSKPNFFFFFFFTIATGA